MPRMHFVFLISVAVPVFASAGAPGTEVRDPEAGVVVPSDSAAIDSGQITAPRPLVAKGTSNVVHTIDEGFFTNLPARGIDPAIILQPGVMTQGTNAFGEPLISVRGGREGEIEYRLEGVPVNDLLRGGRGVAVTEDAVEQIRIQAGGPAAEFGGDASGLVGIQLRTGRADRWGGSLLVESDRYTGMNTMSLGGYSYGYADWTGTAGGPVPGLGNILRLFGSVQNTFYRDPTVSVRSGYNFSGADGVVTDPVVTPYHSAARPDTLNIILPAGNAPGGGDNRWVMTGTALLDLSPLRIRLAGSYDYERNQTPAGLENLLNLSRLPLNTRKDGFVNVRLMHEISPTVSYEAGFSYAATSFVTEDPQLRDNLFSYGDPTANAALGYTFRFIGGQALNWPAYSLWNSSFYVNQAGTQIAGFGKTRQETTGGRASLTFQTGINELKIGGEYTRIETREYAPSSVGQFWNLRNRTPDPATLELMLARYFTGNGWGYDVYGKELDGDDVRGGALYSSGPRKPVIWDGYMQDEIDFHWIRLLLGLRYDFVDPGSKVIADPANLQFSGTGLLLVSSLTDAETYSQFSPRLGVSVPLTERWVLHGQFGRYMKELNAADPYMKPPRIAQYEIGLSCQWGGMISFDVTGFVKSIGDQLSMIAVPQTFSAPISLMLLWGGSGGSYIFIQNGGDVSPKGIEMTFTLRRTHRFAALFNYTLQDVNTDWLASSTSSYGNAFVPVTFLGVDENSVHRGNLRLDYRFGTEDGGDVLEQLGLDLLLTFNSGHKVATFTQSMAYGDPRFRMPIKPGSGTATPWFFQLDGRFDKTLSFGPVSLNVYVYAINLLGTDNAVSVFPRTGDPSNDGWFQSAAGSVDASANGPRYVAFYNAVVNGKNSGNWGPPRQIRFGARVEF